MKHIRDSEGCVYNWNCLGLHCLLTQKKSYMSYQTLTLVTVTEVNFLFHILDNLIKIDFVVVSELINFEIPPIHSTSHRLV